MRNLTILPALVSASLLLLQPSVVEAQSPFAPEIAALQAVRGENENVKVDMRTFVGDVRWDHVSAYKWTGRWNPAAARAMREAGFEEGTFEPNCPEDPYEMHLCRLVDGPMILAVSPADIQGGKAKVRVRGYRDALWARPGYSGITTWVVDVFLERDRGTWTVTDEQTIYTGH